MPLTEIDTGVYRTRNTVVIDASICPSYNQNPLEDDQAQNEKIDGRDQNDEKGRKEGNPQPSRK